MTTGTHFCACCCRYNTGDDDNFSQPSIFWKKTLKPEERDRLVQNIVDHLKDAADFIQVSHLVLPSNILILLNLLQRQSIYTHQEVEKSSSAAYRHEQLAVLYDKDIIQ
jgi:hypothetical protein